MKYLRVVSSLIILNYRCFFSLDFVLLLTMLLSSGLTLGVTFIVVYIYVYYIMFIFHILSLFALLVFLSACQKLS